MSRPSTRPVGSKVLRSCASRISRWNTDSTCRCSRDRLAVPGSTCRPTTCSCSPATRVWIRRSRTWSRGLIRPPACKRAVSTISATRVPAPLRAASDSRSEDLHPMTTSLVTKPIGAVGLFRLLLLGTVLVPLGCTNLDENPPSAITPGNFYRNERSEEHTSELQSPCNLVCRLLLEKKNNDSVTLV